jgi:hypothetical protein
MPRAGAPENGKAVKAQIPPWILFLGTHEGKVDDPWK